MTRRGQKSEPVPRTPEQMALEEARKIADRRVRFFGQVVIWGMVVLFMMVTGGFEPAMVIGVGWGIWLAYRGYHAVLAPDLERKWLEEELEVRRRRIALEAQTNDRRTSRSLEELSASI